MTTIDATQDELRAVAEVLQFAAILDDRAPGPDKARIAAWAEQIHRHRLERADLLDAVQAFYDTPRNHAIAIGDLITQARAIRRDRTEREPAGGRGHDTKPAGPTPAPTSTPGPAPQHSTRLEAAEHRLQTCCGKRDSSAAIREYLAAKANRPAAEPAAKAAGQRFPPQERDSQTLSDASRVTPPAAPQTASHGEHTAPAV